MQDAGAAGLCCLGKSGTLARELYIPHIHRLGGINTYREADRTTDQSDHLCDDVGYGNSDSEMVEEMICNGSVVLLKVRGWERGRLRLCNMNTSAKTSQASPASSGLAESEWGPGLARLIGSEDATVESAGFGF